MKYNVMVYKNRIDCMYLHVRKTLIIHPKHYRFFKQLQQDILFSFLGSHNFSDGEKD